MLNGMRKAGQSLVGKIIATVLFSILILSFAVWGIGDIFRGGPRNVVAQVGETQITTDQYRTAYNRELQRLNRQFRTSITPDQARAAGIDQSVLSRLVTEAVLDERARALGLSVSDELVAKSVVEDPTFRGPNGQFDRNRFENLLRDNSLNEPLYVREQRNAMVRAELAEALTGALPVPTASREALHRFANERRSAAYLILPPAAAGEIAAPTDEQLQAFYTERKSSFRAPEYRSLNVMTVSAEALAKPEAVSDADARQRYEQQKASFGTPERRTIQQIVFPTQQDADAASSRLKEGVAFEALATERNIGAADLELGTFAKSEMLDPAIADAAFALQEGAVSSPIQGRFGPVLVRVTKVQPEAVRPFEEVAGEVRKALAQERARGEIDAAHDAIEDARASARPLTEIAKEKNLTLLQVPAVTRDGRDKSGNPVPNLPEANSLLAAAYTSDIGVDNEALRTSAGGYVWYEIAGIEPARDKTFDEVRNDVTSQWRENEITQKLAEKARQLVERLDKGEAMEAVAAEVNVPAKTATDLARRAAKDDLSAEAVNRIFTTAVGKAGSAPNGADSRAVFKVATATVPPLVTTTQEAQRLEDQLRDSKSDDLVGQFIANAQKDVNVVVYQDTIRQIVGGDV